MSIKSPTGNPPTLSHKIPLSWRSLAVIPTAIPVVLSDQFALPASLVTV